MSTVKISSPSELPRIEKSILTLDTETTDLNKMNDQPFLMTVTHNGRSWAVRTEEAIPWLNDNMPKAEWNVFHNAKFDLHMLLNAGMDESTMDRSKIWCTLVNETLINDHRTSYSLDHICEKRFGVGKRDEELLQWLADHYGGKPDRKHQMKNIQYAPIEMVAYYGVGDTELTDRLFHTQRREIIGQDLERVSNLESEVLKVLVAMERRGVPLNMRAVKSTLTEFLASREQKARQIVELAGGNVNVRSGKQLEAAFKKLGVDIKYNKETGNPVFDKEALEFMDSELAKCILEQRVYGTMIDTFLTRFGDHVCPDGRIRCDFNQTKTDEYGVITGRLSASKPNLMQIPKRNKGMASKVRSVFKAPVGCSWLTCDWRQFEFRVFAHYSNDEDLIQEFHANPEADYHQMISDLTGLERDPYAKQLNLGLVFGMGQGLMAKKCNLPYTSKTENGKVYLMAGPEAKKMFNKYHTALPKVRQMLKKAETVAAQRGYIKTIMGRRIRFPNKNQAYKAGGYIFQGTSADIMKKKLVELDQAFKNTGIELVLPVHDEFDFIIPQGVEQESRERIRDIVQDIPELRLPIRCDIGIAENWWEASK